MKKIFLITGMALLAAAVAAFVPATGNAAEADRVAAQVAETAEIQGKVLVTYFTWPEPDGVDASSGASRVVADGKLYGNTEYVARLIAEATGGDLFAIETEKKYPTPYKALVDEAKREADAGERPRLTTHIGNLVDYNVIFVGYPNWWYDMPMVIYAFFEEYDFKGKTVIPFVTHGGSRFSQSVETIGKLEPEARVVRGPSVSQREVLNARQTVRKWLENQGLLKK